MMTSYLKSAYRPRKRTKTFTGCWTCRGRKVKCDEAKPHCDQCRAKNLKCEGYATRLRWLAHYTSREPFTTTTPDPKPYSARRQIDTVNPQSALPHYEIDSILDYIDSLNTSSNTPADVNIRNFGVFQSTTELFHESAQLNGHGEPNETIDPETRSMGQVNQAESIISPSQSEVAAAWELCDLRAFQLPDDALLMMEPDSFPVDVSQDENRNFIEIYEQGSTSSKVYPSESLSNIDNPPSLPPTMPQPSLLSNQDRYLLHHYAQRVINLFCVIDSTKGPWKTIHLPRVLQSVGELGIMGETSTIRTSLRYALLSTSAFYLSNSQGDDGCVGWRAIGAQYRYTAIGLLKQSMGTHATTHRGKYKEYLATMLSMITINVMSGDTQSCGVHLDGAAQLINYMGMRKTKFSSKAKALHGIYLYLRVLYESTALRTPNPTSHAPSPIDLNSTGISGYPFNQIPVSSETGAPYTPNSLNPTPSGLYFCDQNATEMLACECIYGIPQTLLILLKDSIEIIDRVDKERKIAGHSDISGSLGRQCDELEKRILDWPLEDSLNQLQKEYQETHARIIYHQTKGFHNALIIYFSQQARLLSHRYMRQYVAAVLDSIEAIEDIKMEAQILAAPLFWPALIGATEAHEEWSQQRFQNWYDRVGVYGIKAARTGLKVVQEVWKMDSQSEEKFTCRWRSVVNNSREILMLT